jgi:hypothetical protein
VILFLDTNVNLSFYHLASDYSDYLEELKKLVVLVKEDKLQSSKLVDGRSD